MIFTRGFHEVSLFVTAKLFTGSSSDVVLKNHYLSTAFMAANLDDFSVL
jgi:hypothetical protein